MTFYLFGVLVKPGASPLDPSNWASDLAALVIILGNLSQVQWDVLSDYGTPHAFHILFDRETHRRIETWSYGSNRMFQFINGQGLVAPEPVRGAAYREEGVFPCPMVRGSSIRPRPRRTCVLCWVSRTAFWTGKPRGNERGISAGREFPPLSSMMWLRK